MLAKIPPLMLKALLLPLAKLLLESAGNDHQVAWDTAVAYIKSFDPQSESELRLAVRVAICNLQSNEALAQAGDPATSIAQAIRLRTGALSLARCADKAEALLNKQRSQRPQPQEPAPVAEPDGANPMPEATVVTERGAPLIRGGNPEKRLPRDMEPDAGAAALPKAA